jgi:hypothetical protein
MPNYSPRATRLAAFLAIALFSSGCAGKTGYTPPASMPMAQPAADASLSPNASVLKMLTKQVVIGSTIDPTYGQLNPYGLTVAPSTSGGFTKGDLAVCNFNNNKNVQGTGFTIVALHPTPGSKPKLIAWSKVLVGCNALALGPGNFIWAAAFSANDNPVFDGTGKFLGNIKGKPIDHPFGQVYAQHGNVAAYYETNAGDGTVVRINLGKKFTFDVIAKGFGINHGVPGSIFSPSGLAYNRKIDTLYVVDGQTNTVTALKNVSTIKSGGVTVGSSGTTFSGPSASLARSVFSGSPLNGPISSALLPNGNLVVGNTTDPAGTNLIVEISTSGKLLATRNVDTGAGGSIFGMVATGTSNADTKVYFNDDNDNNLQVLER